MSRPGRLSWGGACTEPSPSPLPRLADAHCGCDCRGSLQLVLPDPGPVGVLPRSPLAKEVDMSPDGPQAPGSARQHRAGVEKGSGLGPRLRHTPRVYTKPFYLPFIFPHPSLPPSSGTHQLLRLPAVLGSLGTCRGVKVRGRDLLAHCLAGATAASQGSPPQGQGSIAEGWINMSMSFFPGLHAEQG